MPGECAEAARCSMAVILFLEPAPRPQAQNCQQVHHHPCSGHRYWSKSLLVAAADTVHSRTLQQAEAQMRKLGIPAQ